MLPPDLRSKVNITHVLYFVVSSICCTFSSNFQLTWHIPGANNCLTSINSRHIDGSIYELVYETEIATRLITNGSYYFPYKYFFKKHEKEGKFEHYTRGGRTGEGANRVLIIQQKYKHLGM